jgi:hypothetical protein
MTRGAASAGVLKGHGFSRAGRDPYHCHHQGTLVPERTAFLLLSRSIVVGGVA